VVAGLYGAGALIAPPEKVSLVIDDTAAETGRLRDHTAYLRDRERNGDLTLPDGIEPPGGI
jgi:hypothetical protein